MQNCFPILNILIYKEFDVEYKSLQKHYLITGLSEVKDKFHNLQKNITGFNCFFAEEYQKQQFIKTLEEIFNCYSRLSGKINESYNVISNGTDYGQMEATLLDIKKAIPDKILESTADKGYESEEDMAGCLLNGIVPHVIPPEGQDTYELTVPYEPEENLDPESKKSEEIKKCLQSGVIREA